jgi:2-oxoglutarate ferredoxin oxidoreductase subunit beta
MTYVAKPKLHHPTLPKNSIGFTRRDYEGKVSHALRRVRHDSISAALIQAFWELDIQPHLVAKLSGIGCSSEDARITSSAIRTASTPCTGGCLPC